MGAVKKMTCIMMHYDIETQQTVAVKSEPAGLLMHVLA